MGIKWEQHVIQGQTVEQERKDQVDVSENKSDDDKASLFENNTQSQISSVSMAFVSEFETEYISKLRKRIDDAIDLADQSAACVNESFSSSVRLIRNLRYVSECVPTNDEDSC